MKAIIPLAGVGTKLRPHTYTQPKALIPIAGKTILSVIIDQLLDEGINEFIFIIGYLGDKIQDYIVRTYPHLNCQFIFQNVRKGTGHAIWLTQKIVKNDEMLIVFGDTIADYDIKRLINSPYSEIGVRRIDDPREFGVAEIDSQDNILKLVEKPKIPKSNMALVGIFKVKDSELLFKTLDEYVAGQDEIIDGEYHLTVAMQRMIENGYCYKAFKVNNWFDCGKKDSLIKTNAILLKSDATDVESLKSLYPNSVFIPPVSIGKDCVLDNAIIGPNVSIGEATSIKQSIISNSIISAYAELEEVVLTSSIIGSDAFVRGMSQSLNIGDNTNIDFGIQP